MIYNYSLKDCEKLIDKYIERDGEIRTIEEGCLGLGVVVLEAPNYKTVVIKEFYINEWTSGHKIRMYNKTPKKYQ